MTTPATFLRSGMLLLACALALPASAQHYQTDFPPEEFKARWAQLFDAIGGDAVAVLQGAPLTNGFIVPRQHNTFYYLCGIETPDSYLLLDGRSRTVTIYLPPRNERLERAEGKVLSAEDADVVRQLTGAHEVRSTAEMGDGWPIGGGRGPAPAIYAESAPPEGQGQSRGELLAGNAAVANDPWDGRLPREGQFLARVRLRNPRSEIRDLTPILDRMRSVKSPREIALIRRASQLAGLGLMEAMRSTEPGVHEYQLDAAARYVFLVKREPRTSTTCTTTGTCAS
jgi:Xaa-Pro aminopeptidase